MEIVLSARNRCNFRVVKVDMVSVVKTAQRENEVVGGYTGDAYCDTGTCDPNQFTDLRKVDMSEKVKETHSESIIGQNRTFVVADTMVKTNMVMTMR